MKNGGKKIGVRADKINYELKKIQISHPMAQLVLRANDVQKILNTSRTESYEVIKEIKASYSYSAKLKGSKIRTEDLSCEFNLKIEEIAKRLKE